MNIIDHLNQLHELNPEALQADGFEDAYLGYATQACNLPLAVYDYDKCVDILVSRDGMTYDEAIEFIEFNVVCAYVGEGTPLFFKQVPPKGTFGEGLDG
jgi:hypothetical protein